MKKIVSIDDEPMMLKCLEKALNNHGYILFTTSDPDEGIKMIKDDPSVCLALLDVKMPVKNGFEIYSEIRQFRKIPVLFVTAYPKSFTTNSDEVMEMWKTGFADGTTDIIYKPFDLASLYEKVESLIGKPGDHGEE